MKKKETIQLQIWKEGRKVSPSGIDNTPDVGILSTLEVDYDKKRGVWTVENVPFREGDHIWKAEADMHDLAILNWLKVRLGYDEAGA